LIAGLVAQNYSAINAAIIGVYIHGLAADITKSKFNEKTMLPSDVVNHYAEAFNSLVSRKN
jgi:NAD(P)H-hydrate epimerase